MTKKTTHGDKDPNPRNKYNLTPETARVGVQIGKVASGVLHHTLLKNKVKALNQMNKIKGKINLKMVVDHQVMPKVKYFLLSKFRSSTSSRRCSR